MMSKLALLGGIALLGGALVPVSLLIMARMGFMPPVRFKWGKKTIAICPAGRLKEIAVTLTYRVALPSLHQSGHLQRAAASRVVTLHIPTSYHSRSHDSGGEWLLHIERNRDQIIAKDPIAA